MNASHCDTVVIVGAGPLGLLMALALSERNIPSILLDKCNEQDLINSPDQRSFAIAADGKDFFKNYNIWDSIKQETSPILDILIMDICHSTSVFFKNIDSVPSSFSDTEERNQTSLPLGYMIHFNTFIKILWEKILKQPCIQCYLEAEILSFDNTSHGVTVKFNYQNVQKIAKGNLLIGADGFNSIVRKKLNIAHSSWDYYQTCLVFNLQHQEPHCYRAYEIFTPQGPFASLPLKDPYTSAIVWTKSHKMANHFMTLSHEVLMEEMYEMYKQKLTPVKLLSLPQSFQVHLSLTQSYISLSTILIGDAAHRIHPIAGQGVNLGIRDIATLIPILEKGKKIGLSLNHPSNLEIYEKERYSNNLIMAMLTDNLLKIFRPKGGMIFLRKMGFFILENSSFLKKFLVDHAMGKTMGKK